MLHPSVVFEKGDIVAKRLDPKDLTELVIHLDSVLTHKMSDRMTLDARGKLTTELTVIAGVKTFTQKHSNVIRLDCMREGTHEFLVNRCKGFSVFEHDIGSVFRLHYAPMKTRVELTDDRTELEGVTYQHLVKFLNRERVGNSLCFFKIVDSKESIFYLFVADISLVKLA